jgi:ABC-type antimicrobial peptide transport system permease subunit
MDEIVSDALRQQRISAVLIAGISLGALLLAAMGLFGLMAGTVTRRRHELAVRMALGAGHDRALRLVMKEGAVLVAIGLLIGLPGVYLGGRLLQGMLFGVSPWDPATLVAVALGLTVVAMAATYIPAGVAFAARLLSEVRFGATASEIWTFDYSGTIAHLRLDDVHLEGRHAIGRGGQRRLRR